VGCFSVVASVPKVLATSVAVVSTTLIRAQEIPRWTHSVLAGARRRDKLNSAVDKDSSTRVYSGGGLDNQADGRRAGISERLTTDRVATGSSRRARRHLTEYRSATSTSPPASSRCSSRGVGLIESQL